jgi:hypothetical protein
MKHKTPVRLLTVAAMAVPATLAVALPATTAFAGKPKPVAITCTGLSGNESSQVVSGCTDLPITGGGGTSTVLSGTSSMITFDSGSGNTATENFTIKSGSGKKDKCPAVSGMTSVVEVKQKGKVTSGTGTGTALVRGNAKATVCVYLDSSNNFHVSLFPGTVLSL